MEPDLTQKLIAWLNENKAEINRLKKGKITINVSGPMVGAKIEQFNDHIISSHPNSDYKIRNGRIVG